MMDRRLFSRTAIEVDGELAWTARKLGRVRTLSSAVKTVDISVDGAQLIVEKGRSIEPGLACQLTFRAVATDATVLAVAEARGAARQVRLGFRHPSAEFLAAVEHWLPTEIRDARPAIRPEWAGG